MARDYVKKSVNLDTILSVRVVSCGRINNYIMLTFH